MGLISRVSSRTYRPNDSSDEEDDENYTSLATRDAQGNLVTKKLKKKSEEEIQKIKDENSKKAKKAKLKGQNNENNGNENDEDNQNSDSEEKSKPDAGKDPKKEEPKPESMIEILQLRNKK